MKRKRQQISLEAARLLGVPFRHIHGRLTFRYKRTPEGYELQYLCYFGVDGLRWMTARRDHFASDKYEPQFYVVRPKEMRYVFKEPNSNHS